MLRELTSVKTWSTFFALCVVLGLGWTMYALVVAITNAQPATVTLVVACVAAVSSVLSIVVGRLIEKQRDIDLKIREQKSRVYGDFMHFLFDFMGQARTGTFDEKASLAFMKKFAPDMILWASSDFITRWLVAFKGHSELQPLDRLAAVEAILRAIRTDLGHNDRRLRQFDLTRLYVNDLDTAVLTSTTTSNKRQ